MRAHKGEWVWQFHKGPDIRRCERGWRIFALVFGKLRKDIPEGVNVGRRDVWGLAISFCYWLPFERY